MLKNLIKKKVKTERLTDPSKRRLFSGRAKSKQAIRLPWVINEEVFNAGCTQCAKCISSCETNIIVKDEEGFPKIDFNLGECTFCNKCIESCEEPLFSGSFAKNNTEKAWPVTIQISEQCLTKSNIYCQSCRDECETSVIKFNFHDSSIPQPSIDDADCSQCGACIKTCPQNAIAFHFESTLT